MDKPKYLFFLNPAYGVDFVLRKKLERENLQFEYFSILDNEKKTKKLYEKHGIRLTPALVVLDNGVETDKLVTTEEILDYFRKNAVCEEI